MISQIHEGGGRAWSVTLTWGNPKESATENKPPRCIFTCDVLLSKTVISKITVFIKITLISKNATG